MDNLSCHKVDGVFSQIEAVGASVLYLSPYSPDFSPIELCWSKVKNYIKTLEPRTFPLLEEVISEALEEVSPSNAAGWFKHCGYLDHSN